MLEQLEILRRIAERGLAFAEAEPAYREVDLWIHMLDEINNTKEYWETYEEIE
jgi:hypothetical protein